MPKAIDEIRELLRRRRKVAARQAGQLRGLYFGLHLRRVEPDYRRAVRWHVRDFQRGA